jgi:hypothetical protein
MAVLPGHTWRGIKNIAERLLLKRDIRRQRSPDYHRWTVEEDDKLKIAYEKGTRVNEIAEDLGRTINAVQYRVAKMGLKRGLPVNGQTHRHDRPKYLQQSSSLEKLPIVFRVFQMASEIIFKMLNKNRAFVDVEISEDSTLSYYRVESLMFHFA